MTEVHTQLQVTMVGFVSSPFSYRMGGGAAAGCGTPDVSIKVTKDGPDKWLPSTKRKTQGEEVTGLCQWGSTSDQFIKES